MRIPAVSRTSYFGVINKVRWYSVTDYFDDYNVDLYIQTSPFNSSQVRIENRSNTNGTEWSENFKPNVTSKLEYRQAKVLHVPNLKALEYVVINQSV